MSLALRASMICDTLPGWQPSVAAWNGSNMDNELYIIIGKLRTYLNVVKTGTTNGQLLFTDRVDSLPAIFFPWTDPKFVFGHAHFWVTAIVQTLLQYVSGGSILTSQHRAVIFAFSRAGISDAGLSTQPE